MAFKNTQNINCIMHATIMYSEKMYWMIVTTVHTVNYGPKKKNYLLCLVWQQNKKIKIIMVISGSQTNQLVEVVELPQQRLFFWGQGAESHPSQSHCRSNSRVVSGPEDTVNIRESLACHVPYRKHRWKWVETVLEQVSTFRFIFNFKMLYCFLTTCKVTETSDIQPFNFLLACLWL